MDFFTDSKLFSLPLRLLQPLSKGYAMGCQFCTEPIFSTEKHDIKSNYKLKHSEVYLVIKYLQKHPSLPHPN